MLSQDLNVLQYDGNDEGQIRENCNCLSSKDIEQVSRLETIVHFVGTASARLCGIPINGVITLLRDCFMFFLCTYQIEKTNHDVAKLEKNDY